MTVIRIIEIAFRVVGYSTMIVCAGLLGLAASYVQTHGGLVTVIPELLK